MFGEATMNERILTRRTMMLASAAAGGTLMAAGAVGPAEAQPASTAISPYTAAVMRVPALVPPNAGALADVRARNAQAMVAAIEDTMKGPGPKPRLIVFPVLQYVSTHRSVSGVPISAVAVDLTSAPLDQGIFAPVIAACRRHNCYVATSTQEMTPKLPGRYFHTGFVMGPEGLVLRSPKSQAKSAPEMSYLRDMMDEYTKVFGPDSILPVAKTPIGVLGCYIEGEAEVFEASRLLASKAAQVIIHPSAEDDEIPWQALKQAIGYQCQVYLLTGATSRNIGEKEVGGGWFGGASTIVGPDGKLIASIGGRNEGAATGMIDLAAIKAAQLKFGAKTTPAWALYRKLYSER
jgi:predicted amidohydrolase